MNWDAINFPNAYHSQNLFNHDSIEDIKKEVIAKPPVMTTQCQRAWYLILGSQTGDLNLVKYFLLKDTVSEKLTKDKMSMAKSYTGHCSFVNQIAA